MKLKYLIVLLMLLFYGGKLFAQSWPTAIFLKWYYPVNGVAAATDCGFPGYACKIHKKRCCPPCQENYSNEEKKSSKTGTTQPANTSNASTQQGATGTNKAFSISQPVSNTANSSQHNQTQAIMDNYNRQAQNNQNTYNAVAGGLQQLGNLHQQQSQEREARRQAAETQREHEEEEKRKKNALKAQEVIEREAREAEIRRIQAAEKEAARNTQFGIDQQVLGKVVQGRKPENDLTQVYYVTYERNYVNNKVNVKTYTLNKYSDGTWMLTGDLREKLNFKDYFNNEGSGLLLGAYGSKQSVIELLSRIRSTWSDAVINNSFLAVNGGAATGTDKDFWNN